MTKEDNAKRASDMKSFIQIARENEKILKANGYVLEPSETIKHQELIPVPDPPAGILYDDPECEGNISVAQETTLAGIQRFARHKQSNVVALNFASGKHPGGGYTTGSKAQEESLCRASNLYFSLLKTPEYYDENEARDTHLFTDMMIYHPEITFFRDDDGNLLEKTLVASIITAPAPKFYNLTDDEKKIVPAIFKVRINRVFQISLDMGHRNLILGAWGCGAYGNDPEMVAKIFKQCLSYYGSKFDNIVFSITDAKMCEIFAETLGL
jgi:uncharacterized protein (TIGR02452 family)